MEITEITSLLGKRI